MTENNSASKDITIRVHSVDQLIDIGKAVLEKLILPPIEEVGLLITDQVRLFRLKNQVSILQKADNYIKEKGIKTKKVATKVMASYLEDCSLEENEALKDKWAALLVNTVKDNSIVDNSLFSYILGQLSPQDAQFLDTIFNAVVSVSFSGKGKVMVHTYQLYFTNKITRNVTGGDISVDNLLRLRLLTEQGTNSEPIVHLSNLGFNFVINCMYLESI